MWRQTNPCDIHGCSSRSISSLNERASNDLSVLANHLFEIDGKIAEAFSTSTSKIDASVSVAKERKK